MRKISFTSSFNNCYNNCCNGEKMGEGYVRDVNVSKAIRTVLATDQQLQDLKRLCPDPSAKDFSVLGVDPPST